MKKLIIITLLSVFTMTSVFASAVCQRLDDNSYRQLIIGKWLDPDIIVSGVERYKDAYQFFPNGRMELKTMDINNSLDVFQVSTESWRIQNGTLYLTVISSTDEKPGDQAQIKILCMSANELHLRGLDGNEISFTRI